MLAIIPFRAGFKAEDCFVLKKRFNMSRSGVYTVFLGSKKIETEVYCDMETDGGGWTVCNEMFINR